MPGKEEKEIMELLDVFFNKGAPLIRTAHTRPVTMEDTVPLVVSATADVVAATYARMFANNNQKANASDPHGEAVPPTQDPLLEQLKHLPFRKAIVLINKKQLLLCCALIAVRLTGMFLQVFSLSSIMQHLTNLEYDNNTAIGFAILLGVGAFLQSWGQHNLFHVSFHNGVRARTLVCKVVFEKMLLQTPLHGAATGQLLNLISTDSNSFVEAYLMIGFLFSAPFEIFGALAWTYFFVGWSFAVTTVFMILLLPVQFYIMNLTASIRDESFVFADKRMRAISEFLGGIGVVKVFAWEKNVEDLINGHRDMEAVQLRRGMVCKLLNLCFFVFVPGILLLVTFGIKMIYSTTMTPTDTFTTMALLQIVARSFQMVPRSTTSLGAALSSLRRLESYLKEDLGEGLPIVAPIGARGGVVLKGSFGWRGFALHDVCLDVRPGTLTVVMGPVGSGKSTLLHAILGNCAAKKGEPYTLQRENCDGGIAYVPQEAWILDGTIRDNILCGRVMDNERYAAVLRACCLGRDITQWGGDLVEVGEKGVTMSGGQKQRVAMARACYGDVNVYLFDDPISAVDAVVGRHLLEVCIRTFLKNKTVILVTHHPAPAQYADYVIHLDGEGRQVPSPSVTSTWGDNAQAPTSALDDSDFLSFLGHGRQLVLAEESAIGSVNHSVYWTYCKAGGYGPFVAFLVLLFVAQATKSGSEWWFAAWSGRKFGLTPEEYVYGELALVGGIIVMCVFRGIVYSHFTIQASTVLHKQMLHSVLHSPMHFFESVPLGRIANRFGKDVDTVDDLLIRSSFDFFQLCCASLGSLVLMIYAIPWFAIIVAVLLLVYGYLVHFFMPASRYLKRIEATSRSPSLQIFQSTVSGLSCVRAFGMQSDLRRKFLHSLDGTSTAITTADACQRWVGSRMDGVSIAWVISVGLFAVLLKDSVGPELAGLALAQSLLLTGTLQYSVRQAAEAEAQMTSTERIAEYGALVREPNLGTYQPPSSWPSQGEIVVNDLTICHVSNPTEVVLDSLSFRVLPGEKVAVVGRTGAGKSTLLSCFFRMLPVPPNSISIDGVFITDVELGCLRRSLGVIPQSPTLFQGSLRANLDPFHQFTDDAMILALKKVQLDDFVSARGLDADIGESGSTMSVGQKQLLCAARVLLLEPKILFMDEATANVDEATDANIQRVIRQECVGITVITIAHRLNTIMDYDKVVVLAHGKVVEVGVPLVLSAKDATKPENVFASMVAAMNRT